MTAVGGSIFLYGFRQGVRARSTPSHYRLIVGCSLYVVELAGALALACDSLPGLYVAAVAIVLNVAFMISAAWLLVVSVYSAETTSPPPR